MRLINKKSIDYCLTRAQLINVRQISLLLSLTLNDCFGREDRGGSPAKWKPQRGHIVSAIQVAWKRFSGKCLVDGVRWKAF